MLKRLVGLPVLAAAILAASPARADYKQAVAYYMQGQYEKAIQELKPDMDQNPDWESGHRLLGLCYLNLKNNALAVSSLSRAVQLRSTAPATYLGLAQAYFNMQKYDSCLQALDQGDPFVSKGSGAEVAKSQLLKGSASFRSEDWNDAVTSLTQALRSNASDPSIFSMLGIAYFNLNRTEDSIQALEKALSLRPGQSNVTDLLGKAYFKKGTAALSDKQYAAAIQNLNKARSYDPKNGYIFYNLGESFLFQKNYSEAEKSYKQAADVMPKSPDIFMRIGLVYEKQQKWDMALDAYRRADQMSPSKGLKDAIARVEEEKKQ